MHEKPQNNSKETEWQCKLGEFGEVGDALGEGIDERIKETVAAFNLVGLNTYASCEGHLEWGIGAPWVDVQAEGEPDERFIGEKKIIEKIAKKYGITYEDVERANNKEAWVEAIKIFSENEETPESKAWSKKNERLRERLPRYQAEMSAFGEFLKDKFFNS